MLKSSIQLTVQRRLSQSTQPKIQKKKENSSILGSFENDLKKICIPRDFVVRKPPTVSKMVPKHNDVWVNTKQYFNIDKDIPKNNCSLVNELKYESTTKRKNNEKKATIDKASSLSDKDKFLENEFFSFYQESGKNLPENGDFISTEKLVPVRKEDIRDIMMKSFPSEYLRSDLTEEIDFLNSEVIKPDTIVIYEEDDDDCLCPQEEIDIDIGNLKKKSVIHDSYSSHPIFGRILEAYHMFTDSSEARTPEQKEGTDFPQEQFSTSTTVANSLSSSEYKIIKMNETFWSEINDKNENDPDSKIHEPKLDGQTTSKTIVNELPKLVKHTSDIIEKSGSNKYHQSMNCSKNTISQTIEPVLSTKIKQRCLLGKNSFIGGLKHFSTCPVLNIERADEEKERLEVCKKQLQLPCIKASEIFVDLGEKRKQGVIEDCERICLPCCIPGKEPPVCTSPFYKAPCKRRKPPRPSFSECKRNKVSPEICGCSIPRLPRCEMGKSSSKGCYEG